MDKVVAFPYVVYREGVYEAHDKVWAYEQRMSRHKTWEAAKKACDKIDAVYIRRGDMYRTAFVKFEGGPVPVVCN